MLERLIMNVKEVFGFRSQRAKVATTVEKLSQHSRKVASDAINDMLIVLTTTDEDPNGK